MEHVEIERKWRMREIPEGIKQLPYTEMEQGYLCTDPVVRVRKEDDSYWLTYKGAGLMIREEYNLPLNETAYRGLIEKADGLMIRKRRYRKKIETGHTAEIDVFAGEYAGLVLLEVEFDSREAAEQFQAPAWFGTEVTGDPAYSNSSLSEGKRPTGLAKP